MKAALASLLILLAIAGSGRAADPDPAPYIDHQVKVLTKRVDDDLGAGTLTQSDADELKREIEHVKTIEQSEPSLTPMTRRELREELSKIDKDLGRKEGQTKAPGAASPSATP